MKKSQNKLIYVCQQCGYSSPKWLGKCPDCNSWSSFQEEIQKSKHTQKQNSTRQVNYNSLLNSKIENQKRIQSNLIEFDRTIGGGIVPGSVLIVGGDPGIGKSTLMLQMLNKLGDNYTSVYVSGEESHSQILMRANRVGVTNSNIQISNETNLESLLQLFSKLKPGVVVIDSIQTIYTEEIDYIPGNISQIRACGNELLKYAKENNSTIFLIGHVTKEGSIAGPKVLEHMVDTVLYFEGDNQYDFRILRSIKNRFGQVNEIGLFRMTEAGVVTVANPSQFFIYDYINQNSGNEVTSDIAGKRTFLD